MASRPLSPECLAGFSVRQALETAARFDLEGRMPQGGEEYGLSTSRWAPNYSDAAVISENLRSQVPTETKHLYRGGKASFLLPLPSDLQRAAITQGNTGANLVADGPAQFLTEALHPAPLLEELGARIVNLNSGSAFVLGAGDGIAHAWYADGAGPATPSIGTTLGVTAKARTLISVCEISRKLLQQTTDNAEQLLLDDLLQGVRDGLEAAAFAGTGSSGQPTGVVNLVGANSTAFATASPTRAELLQMLDDLADDGVDISRVQFAVSPQMAVLLHSVTDASSSPIYDGREMFGRPVRVSANVPTGKVLAGDWRQLVLCQWGRIEISRAQSVRPDFLEKVRAVALADLTVLRPQSFAVGSAP